MFYQNTFICSSSAISFFSAAVAITVAILGFNLITEAFFANPRVENVYLWYVTSGRMAQKR